jgi:4-amino-4-deoxy-L-arabinose transferase-like glycosyltransferase
MAGSGRGSGGFSLRAPLWRWEVTHQPILTRIRSVARHHMFYLCLVLIGYGVLLLPTLGRQGISWDEQTDIAIARSYIAQPEGWFIGSDSDPSQTRLPMYVVALAYALAGTDDLLTARLVSAFVGALTIVGVYVFCQREFDAKRGLLAAAILATSPFFLSFARIAFTETDIYVACVFAWLLVCVSFLRERGTVGWAAVSGGVMGLAISAKFTAIFLFPALLLYVLTWPQPERGVGHLRWRDLSGVGLALAIVFALAWFGWSGGGFSDGPVAAMHYLLTAAWWGPVLVWFVRRYDHTAPALLLAVLAILVAASTFVMVPPVHLTNPDIVTSLRGRFDREMGWNPQFMVEAVALHLSSVIFKSSPLVGLSLLAGLAASLFHWRRRGEVRFPLLVVMFYCLGLALLPIAQTFYMMPLLPILAILAADQWFNFMSWKSKLAVPVGVAAAALLVLDLFLCYPDYNLNGYQWLGARYLVGRASIGYRSVVQTTSDGVQQATRWVCENAKAGERVVTYVHPWHIVEATCPNPPFRFVAGRWITARSKPDFVMVHINHQIRQSWAGDPLAGDVFWYPYDVQWLQENYNKVFSVPRSFGIEAASVWQRNDLVRQ